MAKFKIGDRVRVLNHPGAGGSSPYKIGDIKVISCIKNTSDSYKYFLDMVSRTGNECECGKHYWVFKESELELVKEEKTEYKMYDHVMYDGHECIVVKKLRSDYLTLEVPKDYDGWHRNSNIPNNYIEKLSNTYWNVGMSDIKPVTYLSCQVTGGSGGSGLLGVGSTLSLDSVLKIDKSSVEETFLRLYPHTDSGYKLSGVIIKEDKKKTIMSKITEFAKNLVLSADEKLLRKHDLKDSCGEYTEEAGVIVMQKIMKDNEEYLISIAKQLEEETKSTK